MTNYRLQKSNIYKLQLMEIYSRNEPLWVKAGNRELNEVDHSKYTLEIC